MQDFNSGSGDGFNGGYQNSFKWIMMVSEREMIDSASRGDGDGN